jgi:hypothetical protein
MSRSVQMIQLRLQRSPDRRISVIKGVLPACLGRIPQPRTSGEKLPHPAVPPLGRRLGLTGGAEVVACVGADRVELAED